MRSLWSWWLRQTPDGAESASIADAAGPCDPDVADLAADAVLRYAVRGEVAGAGPPAEAWARLERRIAATSVHPAVAVSPWDRLLHARPHLLLRPYASQLGAAVLTLLVMLGAMLPGVQAPSAVLGQDRPAATLHALTPAAPSTRAPARATSAVPTVVATQVVAQVQAPEPPPSLVVVHSEHAPDGIATPPTVSDAGNAPRDSTDNQPAPVPPYTPALGLQPW